MMTTSFVKIRHIEDGLLLMFKNNDAYSAYSRGYYCQTKTLVFKTPTATQDLQVLQTSTKEQLDQTDAELKTRNSELDAERASHLQSKQRLEAIEAQHTTLSAEKKQLESDLLRLQAILEAKEGELNRLTERMDKMDEKQEVQNKESRQEREALRDQVQTLSGTVSTLQVDNTNHLAAIAEKDRNLERMHNELTEAQTTLAAIQEEIATLRVESSLNREQCVAQTSMREQLQAQWEDLQKEHIATAAQLQSTVQMHEHSVQLQKEGEEKAKVVSLPSSPSPPFTPSFSLHIRLATCSHFVK